MSERDRQVREAAIDEVALRLKHDAKTIVDYTKGDSWDAINLAIVLIERMKLSEPPPWHDMSLALRASPGAVRGSS